MLEYVPGFGESLFKDILRYEAGGPRGPHESATSHLEDIWGINALFMSALPARPHATRPKNIPHIRRKAELTNNVRSKELYHRQTIDVISHDNAHQMPN